MNVKELVMKTSNITTINIIDRVSLKTKTTKKFGESFYDISEYYEYDVYMVCVPTSLTIDIYI